MIDDEHHEALGAMIHAMKPRDYHREIADEHDRLRDVVQKLIEYEDHDSEAVNGYELWCDLIMKARAILKEPQRD